MVEHAHEEHVVELTGHVVHVIHRAFFEFDIDAFGTGIQCVFDQFFDHGCRPFDHFTGGDLIDEGIG